MKIIISEINNFNRNIEPTPPIGSKFLIEFFNSIYHNKILELPSSLYHNLEEEGIYDLEPGTSYSYKSYDEIEKIINKIDVKNK